MFIRAAVVFPFCLLSLFCSDVKLFHLLKSVTCQAITRQPDLVTVYLRLACGPSLRKKKAWVAPSVYYENWICYSKMLHIHAS